MHAAKNISLSFEHIQTICQLANTEGFEFSSFVSKCFSQFLRWKKVGYTEEQFHHKVREWTDTFFESKQKERGKVKK